jgi:hypothetical protein
MQHCPQNLYQEHSGLNKGELTEHLCMSFAASKGENNLIRLNITGDE